MEAQTPESILRDKHFPYNFIVNVLDGGAFGFGMGFASFSTIIPLFISSLTDSAILIGLIPAIHTLGWQLPQLFIARSVSQKKRYKPMALALTIQERIPFMGLAVLAWFSPGLKSSTTLLIAFFMLAWQAIGAGFTATPWQSLIAKIVPNGRWGLFLGTQAAAMNLLAGVSAVLAGLILDNNDSPIDFTLCFLLACVGLIVSYFSLSLTREEDSRPIEISQSKASYWGDLVSILKVDKSFRWFLLVRMLAQVATLGFAFYTVYAVRYLGVSEIYIGFMTGIMTIAQTIANPLMGWVGDHWIHRGVMTIGVFSAVVSAAVAWISPSPEWFFLVFALAGIANVGIWTISMTLTLEFGNENNRPVYIGLANTLVAPTALLFPLMGGWLADNYGYPSTFIASVLGGIATIAVMIFFLRTPNENRKIE